MIKLYNTLTRSIEEFTPINKDEVRIYSCGPTVYDHAHIGNLSSYIYADTLRRVLELNGYKVRHVMNYTDIDDKTIQRSRDKYPDLDPKDALKKLTEEYIDLFTQDIEKVGINTKSIEFVRASDYIGEMQELIKELVSSGIAYVAEDGIYFSIEAYKSSGKTYGQLSNITTSSTSSSRIDNDEYDKDSAHDFALWKKQKPGEPAWDFELDGHDLKGRPGWHIECSAMSENTLGQPFDIHTGGVDLIFPHHENEIAQSTGAKNESRIANLFFHNNHLLVDGKKMAKSAKNFYTLQDIIDKDYDPLAFRLLVLQSHYRSESNFSWDILDGAQSRLNHWSSMFDRRWQLDVLSDDSSDITKELLEIVGSDLNIAELASKIDAYFNNVDSNNAMPARDTLITIRDGLGIDLLGYDITDVQKQLIKKREEARENKDWEESDKLRDELQKQGIGVRDTDNGTVWYRI